jgi:hypothetical protein
MDAVMRRRLGTYSDSTLLGNGRIQDIQLVW